MTRIRPQKEAIRITKFWREYGPDTYPILLDQVVDFIINPALDGEKLSLVYNEFDSFDGLMRPISERQWIAVVNSRITSPGRKNFTGAHEIFHFLAHRHIVQEFSCSRRDLQDYDVKEMEVEANEFASQLILPPDKIRPFTTDPFRYDTVHPVARNLGASVSAVSYKWLKLCGKPVAFFVSRDGFVDQGYASPKAYARGIYFKSGMELPSSCLTSKVHEGGTVMGAEFGPKTWHREMGGTEYVHRTSHEDFTYTFLNFAE